MFDKKSEINHNHTNVLTNTAIRFLFTQAIKTLLKHRLARRLTLKVSLDRPFKLIRLEHI